MKVRVDGRLKEYADIKRRPGVVVPLVQAHLLQLGDVDDRPSNVIHPSEMCKADWCERATYLRIAGVKYQLTTSTSSSSPSSPRATLSTSSGRNG